MQATDLGRYLLYDAGREFVAARTSSTAITSAAQPSDNSDWSVTEEGGTFRISNELQRQGPGRRRATATWSRSAKAPAATPRLSASREASGCAAYPEVEINVTGKPTARKPPYVEIRGLRRGPHAPDGLRVPRRPGPLRPSLAPLRRALRARRLPRPPARPAARAVLENVLFGNPARCHDPVGWPTFKDWPHHQSLTHEQSYYRWLERA